MSGFLKCELSVTASGDGPVYAVVADLPAEVAGALDDALALARHARSLGPLDAEAALALRTLAELSDRMTPPAGVDGARVHALAVAVARDAAGLPTRRALVAASGARLPPLARLRARSRASRAPVESSAASGRRAYPTALGVGALNGKP